MAKAVFLSLPMHGHTNPSLPLVHELVQRGEEVTYLSSAPFADKIEATGARYRPYANSFLSDMSGLPERMEALGWLLMRTTAEILEQEMDAIRAEKPDYLIVDSVAPWGQWIGEILGLPVVTSISTFAFNRKVLAYSMKQGVRPKSRKVFLSKLRHVVNALRLRQAIRRRYRVRGPDLMGLLAGRSGCNIVYTSRHFQPCVETFDDTFHFVGPSIQPRVEAQPFPWSSQHNAMVYVSLGTLFNSDASFYRMCIEALAPLDREVLMSIGTRVSREDLGDLPSNVSVREYVPQLETLERTSLFISHGGMNSVSESLYYGVPLLIIPQMSEQNVVGCRVQELGAGVCLDRELVTTERLGSESRRLLTDVRAHQQAELIRQSFLQSGGIVRAADVIVNYVGRRRERMPA